MKFSFSTLLILLVTVSSNQILAQKSKRFEEFKEMKMNFILKNTNLTKNEKKYYELIGWLLEDQLQNELLFSLKIMKINTTMKYGF